MYVPCNRAAMNAFPNLGLVEKRCRKNFCLSGINAQQVGKALHDFSLQLSGHVVAGDFPTSLRRSRDFCYRKVSRVHNISGSFGRPRP